MKPFFCLYLYILISCSNASVASEPETAPPIKTIPVDTIPTDTTTINTAPVNVDSDKAILYGSTDTYIYRLDPNTCEIIDSIKNIADFRMYHGLSYKPGFLHFIDGRGEQKLIEFNIQLNTTKSFETIYPYGSDGLTHDGDLLYILDFFNNTILAVDLLTEETVKTIIPEVNLIGGISYAKQRNSFFAPHFYQTNVRTADRIYEISMDGDLINEYDPPSLIIGIAYSNSKNVLYVSGLNDSLYVTNPNNGNILARYKGRYSGLAADAF